MYMYMYMYVYFRVFKITKVYYEVANGTDSLTTAAIGYRIIWRLWCHILLQLLTIVMYMMDLT